MELATFASGCFWCTEAFFQRLKGVYNVKSGYTGGHVKSPTYREICSGLTMHTEGIQFEYDPSVIAYSELLEVFWKMHDPTTLNRQGNDVGTQYRSAIFYHTQEQKEEAIKYRDDLNRAAIWDSQIVTEIAPVDVFYEAEIYHKDYYNSNKSQPYCSYIINPKMAEFKRVFKDKLAD
ncbi:MAG: peptide-methionine (S)-S-oxide reductase [Cyclobacteriaceae bacterium]|jgi:peptide-methionine (S)-S-oxide reductase